MISHALRLALSVCALVSVCVAGPLSAHAAPSDIIPLQEARAKIKEGAFLVDVRSPEEYESGHIEGAVNIPHDQVESRTGEFGKDLHRDIVLYCGSGRRANFAADVLRKQGYTSVFNAGGYDELKL